MKLGVTGGVASGKSTVCAILEQLGAAVLSADRIAHELTASGMPLALAVIAEFGPDYSEPGQAGAIDRAKLGSLIFSDPNSRRRLEAITHPVIIAEQDRQIAKLAQAEPGRLIAVEIPLLYEAGVEDRLDKVLVAYSDRATQIARLRARLPTLSEVELAARIDSQIPLSEKIARAEFWVDTGVPMSALRGKVAAIFDKLASSKV
jgi:dephospho-CoA kinase